MHTQIAKARRLADRLGGSSGGEFAPAGVPVSRLAAEHGTPLYLYHGETIVERLRAVRAALDAEADIFYSLKANPGLAICQLLAGEGAGAEIASEGELILARAAAFPPEATVFAGPGKTDAELTRAVRAGICAVHVESLGEIARLARIAEREGRAIGVGLRINPAAQLIGAHMRMAGTTSQFGLDQADIPAALAALAAHPLLHLRGIHVYTATQAFDADALVAQCHAVLAIGKEVAARHGAPLEMIDFGGGFGVPYFAQMEDFPLERFGAGFRGVAAAARAEPWLAGSRLLIELGRYLVAAAGVYVTRVVDVKRAHGKTFVITDGGMNHHLTATGNLGQVFRKPYPLLNLSRIDTDPGATTATVAGPCCTPLDLFGTDIPLAEPDVGDLVGVFYSGAYGFSASSLRFLSHPAPAEVLLWRGAVHLMRPGEAAEDVLTGQRALP